MPSANVTTVSEELTTVFGLASSEELADIVWVADRIYLTGSCIGNNNTSYCWCRWWLMKWERIVTVQTAWHWLDHCEVTSEHKNLASRTHSAHSTHTDGTQAERTSSTKWLPVRREKLYCLETVNKDTKCVRDGPLSVRNKTKCNKRIERPVVIRVRPRALCSERVLCVCVCVLLSAAKSHTWHTTSSQYRQQHTHTHTVHTPYLFASNHHRNLDTLCFLLSPLNRHLATISGAEDIGAILAADAVTVSPLASTHHSC